MKKELLRVTSVVMIIYLTAGVLNLDVTASPPSGGNGTHICGVIDGQSNKQDSDQFPNRRYRTSVANLDVGEPFTVRVIHFIPNDREPDPTMDTKLDRLTKDLQQFYADQMEAHGFGRKTFRFEADDAGNVVVHRVNGKYNDAYYQQPSPPGSWIVWEEIEAQFDMSRNIYLLALDSINPFLNGDPRFLGLGTGSSLNGQVLIPASKFDGAAHELGHGFGLAHGDPAGTQIRTSPTIGDPMISSFCAAEWLDGSRYFNSSENNTSNKNTDIEILAPSLAAPPYSICLRFEVADPDGLHQAQLLLPEGSDGFPVVIACKRLSGKRTTAEFVTTKLIGAKSVRLAVIDGHGNFIFFGREFPIDITALLPPPEAISMPDPNLATAVRETLGMASGDVITQYAMLNLNNLNAGGRRITDLTGIESATNLTSLHLGNNAISDISAVAGLTNLRTLILPNNAISDISVLAGLTNLTLLHLGSNSISDISAVAGLTNLTFLDFAINSSISDISAVTGLTNLTLLHLGINSISDISAIAGLTNLRRLILWNNAISDISAVAGLTNLEELELENNSISDISAVAGLTNLIELHLAHNLISDISPVAGLTNLTNLNLVGNSVSDISAIAGLTNLTSLFVSNNSISDISAIAGLTNLRRPSAGGNSISDISAIANLTNLTTLSLWNNSIADISAVAGLTNLLWLDLDTNSVSDISAVAGLTRLTTLYLGRNSISDISEVSGLVNLTGLFLWNNSISDLSPLIANKGLERGDMVNVVRNPLSYQSIHTYIPTLERRGIQVDFDNQPHPALLKISGDNQKGASFTPLSQPFIVEAQDANGSAITGISVTFAVIAGGGTLSTTITMTDENGRAQSTLILGPNLGTNTVEVSAANIESTATFYAIADSELPPTIADVNNDGLVNVLDLILIASSLGQAGQNAADVNGDGVVSILDLVLAAGMFDDAAAAPSAQPQVPETLTAVEVQGWLTDARSLETKDPIMKRGIVVLEQLLVSLTPTETELLANYPNPFNPETWIPYHLANDSDVLLSIYDTKGALVRELDLGHQRAGYYTDRSRAAYWDGHNEWGERVVTGVYFYQLRVADYSQMRKMVIVK